MSPALMEQYFEFSDNFFDADKSIKFKTTFQLMEIFKIEANFYLFFFLRLTFRFSKSDLSKFMNAFIESLI